MAKQARSKILWSGFHGFEQLMLRLPKGRTEFFDTSDFPWTKVLEAGWAAIRAELDGVLRVVEMVPTVQEISPEQTALTTDQRWKTFWFYVYGQPVSSNTERCPDTTALLAEIPGLRTAMFSILRGPKHLPPHRGTYKGVLRYHLGLKIPNVEACRIRVGSQTRHWAEGASLIFDDTFDHEAFNETDEDRVVLFVDFLRPLPPPVNVVNRRVVDAIGKTSRLRAVLERTDRWEDLWGAEMNRGMEGDA